jgi:hypothetical protein
LSGVRKKTHLANNFPGSYKNGRNLEKFKKAHILLEIRADFYVGEG